MTILIEICIWCAMLILLYYLFKYVQKRNVEYLNSLIKENNKLCIHNESLLKHNEGILFNIKENLGDQIEIMLDLEDLMEDSLEDLYLLSDINKVRTAQNIDYIKETRSKLESKFYNHFKISYYNYLKQDIYQKETKYYHSIN